MYKLNLSNIRDSRFHKIQDALYVDVDKLLSIGAMIGGGALRTLIDEEDVVSDIDLFFRHKDHIDATQALLEDCGYAKVFECPLGHLTTYYYFSDKVVGKRYNGKDEYEVLSKVQLITRDLYTSLEHLVSTFDLMPCCAAMDSNHLVFADKWLKSVKKKMLYLNALTYPVATLNRVDKYKKKGYYASEPFYVDIIREIQGKQFDGEQLALYID